ncbi:MAG: hypothetical protein P8X95_27605 [Anaerolineales bacterium]
MWNQFEFFNKSLKDEIKTKAKRLLLGWAVWSVLVLALFAGFWFWQGMPQGPDGAIRTWVMMLGISVIAPPIVWLIGKAMIG